MIHEYSMTHQYRIKEYNEWTRVSFNRDIFNDAYTGRFVAYAKQIERYQVQVLIEKCSECFTPAHWVSVASLDYAGNWIECDHCGARTEAQS